MPAIRVMNWNIEQLSWTKIRIAGMATALARTIHAQNVDIVVLLEVRKNQWANIMTNLTAALNGLAAGNPWVWFISYSTGGEYYGFLVRNLDLIRPLDYVDNPNVPAADRTDGTEGRPFDDLTKLQWTTWPNNVWPLAGALPAARPRIGLCDTHASRGLVRRAAKKPSFGGQRLGAGGYSLGRGFRLPCLAIFHVHTAAGDYFVPIVACHYAAVRGGRNFLAQQQVYDLRLLHAPQLFSYQDLTVYPLPAATAGYLDVNGAPHLVREVMFTGDFNLDFKRNSVALGANHLRMTNHNAYLGLTPTVEQGGSAAPPAAPGAAPAGAAPGVPFAAFAPGPVNNTIPRQALRAALTTEGSILRRFSDAPALAPANTAALRDAAFDNFFYGGTQLNTAVVNFGAGNVDSANVVDVPANVVQPGGAPAAGQVDVSGAYAHHFARGTRDATHADAARLAAGPGALTLYSRWIGARFLSDHLPVVLQFNCP